MSPYLSRYFNCKNIFLINFFAFFFLLYRVIFIALVSINICTVRRLQIIKFVVTFFSIRLSVPVSHRYSLQRILYQTLCQLFILERNVTFMCCLLIFVCGLLFWRHRRISSILSRFVQYELRKERNNTTQNIKTMRFISDIYSVSQEERT
jgi:hypothetical protein